MLFKFFHGVHQVGENYLKLGAMLQIWKEIRVREPSTCSLVPRRLAQAGGHPRVQAVQGRALCLQD